MFDRRIFLAVFSTLVVLSFIIPGKSPLSAPGDLKEGDMISAADEGDNDIFIINEHGYKRLFLNPVIFGFYGHLGGYQNVKKVSKETRDLYITSSYFRNCETGDQRIYAVELTGDDAGALHWLNIEASEAVAQDPNFFKKVFCINNNEFGWYPKGDSYTSLSQAPDYSFVVPPQAEHIKVDLKINGSDSVGSLDWNETVTATWTSQGATRCEGFYYLNLADDINRAKLPLNGSIQVKASNTVPSEMKQVTFEVICFDALNNYRDDYVSVPINQDSLPSIGGVSISAQHVIAGNDYQITWSSEKLDSDVSIMIGQSQGSDKLGKFWYIAKDIPNTGSYTWEATSAVQANTVAGTTGNSISDGQYFILVTDAQETIIASSNSLFEFKK